MNQTRVPAPQLRESLFSRSLGQEGLWATSAGVCWPQRRTDWCPLQSPESGLLLTHTQSGLVAPPKIGGRDAHSTKPRTDPWSAERNIAPATFALSSRPLLSLCLSLVSRLPLSRTTCRPVPTHGLLYLNHILEWPCKHPSRNGRARRGGQDPRRAATHGYGYKQTSKCLACRRNRI